MSTVGSWRAQNIIQIDHILHICNNIFAMLERVTFVKVSCYNNKWKGKTKIDEDYVGRKRSSAASISYFGVTLVRVLS